MDRPLLLGADGFRYPEPLPAAEMRQQVERLAESMRERSQV
jgi:hypothetical protein